MKYVKVKFINGYSNSLYDFQTNLDLTVGDIVVCDTINGLQLATVKRRVESSSRASKWIVDRVDVTEHLKRVEKEAKIKKMKSQMENLTKQVIDICGSGNDEQIQKLLEEMRYLQGRVNELET